MPGAKVFVDSTTFLYSIDAVERSKGRLAQSWLNSLTRNRAGMTNLQVLNEVASVITRKAARFGASDPFITIDAFATFGSAALSHESALAARQIFLRHHYSWWDCLLLASALDLGCTHFLSEDLQSGHQITDDTGRALTIIDPFAHSPEQILA